MRVVSKFSLAIALLVALMAAKSYSRSFEGDPTMTVPDPANDVLVGEEYVGQLIGEYQVLDSGAFHYSLPIEIPPGINDVQPDLSFNYVSGGGNGPLGLGWSLGGLSKISRCRADYIRDGYTSGIVDGQGYKYCFDDERLVEVASGEFRTEQESFLRIYKRSTHWEVISTDGTIARYGSDSSSRHGEYAWHLDRATDIWGNYYSVAYEEDSNNSIRPKRIDYTFTATTANHFSIVFNYESRADEIYYRYGDGHIQLNERLKSVQVLFNNTEKWRYKLSYQGAGGTYFGKVYSDPIYQSRLWKIERCFQGNFDCQAPLEFDWSSRTAGDYTYRAVGGDVVDAYEGLSDTSLLVDVDNNGVLESPTIPDDFGAQLSGDVPVEAVEYEISGTSATREKILNLVRYLHEYEKVERYALDVNGDGFDDVVVSDPKTTGLRVFLNQSSPSLGRNISLIPDEAYRIPNADLSFYGRMKMIYIDQIWRPEPWKWVAHHFFVDRRFEYGTQLIDFNGDGLLDLVRFPDYCRQRKLQCEFDGVYPQDISVAYNTGSGWEKENGKIKFYPVLEDRHNGNYEQALLFLDLNNDGAIDLTSVDFPPDSAPVETIYLNQGGDKAGQRLVKTIGFKTEAMNPFFGDFNGDGVEDTSDLSEIHLGGETSVETLVGNANAKSLKGSLEICKTFTIDEELKLALASAHCSRDVYDFNGDGFDDIVDKGWCDANSACSSYFSDKTTGVVWLSNGKKFLDPIPYMNGGVLESSLGQDAAPGIQGIFDHNNDSILDNDSRFVSGLTPNRIEGVIAGDIELRVDYSAIAGSDATLSSGDENVLGTVHGKDVVDENISRTSLRVDKRYGVKSLRMSNGAGGFNQTSYTYYGPLYHAGGYGSLGFSKIELRAYRGGQNYTRRVREFLQLVDPRYVVSGLPYVERYYVSQSGGVEKLIEEKQSFWKIRKYADDVDGGGSASPHFFPYLLTSSTQKWGLDGNHLSTTIVNDFSGMALGSRSCETVEQRDLLGNHVWDVSAGSALDSEYSNEGVLKYTETLHCDAPDSDNSQKIVINAQSNNSPYLSFGDAVGLVSSVSNYAWVGETLSGEPGNINGFSHRSLGFGYHESNGALKSEATQHHSSNVREKITKTFAYDSFGYRSSVVESWQNEAWYDGLDFNSRTTTHTVTVNPDGTRLIVTNKPILGESRALIEPIFGRVIERVDENGLPTYFDYDRLGRPILVTYPNDNTAETFYRECDNCDPEIDGAKFYIQTKSTGSAAARVYFDGYARKRATRTRDILGDFLYEEVFYDVLGRKFIQTLPHKAGAARKLIINQYDILDRLRRTNYPDQKFTERRYEGLTVVSVNKAGQETVKKHNAAGWVTQALDNLGVPVDYIYYHFGELRTTVVDNDPDTKITVSYDGLGRKNRVNDPDSGENYWHINAIGKVGFQYTSQNKFILYNYDQLGRVTSRVDDYSGSGSVSHAWLYDHQLKGFVDSVDGQLSDKSSYREEYVYNEYGQPTREFFEFANGYQVSGSKSYDDFGRLLSRNLVMGQSSLIYNEWGHPSMIVGTSDREVLWEANETNELGLLNEFYMGDGSTTTKTYNTSNGHLQQISSEINGSRVIDHLYVFDDVGNLTEREDAINGLTQSFCYDELNRLKAARFSGCSQADEDYTYDALGNVKFKSGVGEYGYSRNGAGPHAVTGANGLSYSYDSAGNQVAAHDSAGDQVRSVSYNVFNKPTSINDDGKRVDIAYAPSGRRATKIDHSGAVTYYVPGYGEFTNDASDLEVVFNITENVSHILSTKVNFTYYEYYHLDHLGSVIRRSSPFAANNDAFDPWGVRLLSAWDGVPWGDTYFGVDPVGYTGHEHLDDVELIHMNGRVYDPTLGRFLSPDVVVQAPYNTQSYNRYSYVYNNPLSYVDPTGYVADDDEGDKYGISQEELDEARGGDDPPSYESYNYGHQTSAADRAAQAFADSNFQIMAAVFRAGDFVGLIANINGVDYKISMDRPAASNFLRSMKRVSKQAQRGFESDITEEEEGKINSPKVNREDSSVYSAAENCTQNDVCVLRLRELDKHGAADDYLEDNWLLYGKVKRMPIINWLFKQSQFGAYCAYANSDACYGNNLPANPIPSRKTVDEYIEAELNE